MACGRKPTCGSAGAAVTPSVLSDIGWILGVVGSIASAIGFFGKDSLQVLSTLFGVSAPAYVWLAAVVGAVIAIAVVFDFWRLRCLSKPDTQTSCSAGVIEKTVPAFGSATDEIFPFTAMHDRADVVVKCEYWFRVENLAAWVFCNTDSDTSPILRCYYHSATVCAAGAGSTVGAVVGGVGGAFLGAFLAGLAAGAVICTASLIWYWICIIVAVIIAAVVAAVCALVGAYVGGQIGKATASDPGPTADDGSVLMQGDYVTTQGGLLTSGDDQGARVYWFVNMTTLHGRSIEHSPFSHTDPDAMLTMDACPP
jgi:hypothetical protein